MVSSKAVAGGSARTKFGFLFFAQGLLSSRHQVYQDSRFPMGTTEPVGQAQGPGVYVIDRELLLRDHGHVVV